MTDHLRRAKEYLAIEEDALRLAARRARLLDHSTNRGTEAEQAIGRWLRERLEPDYTVSSGEIIDSFDTDVDLDSRQQDVIIHENSMDANRFLLPNGLRLVPIESVAGVVEVKLTLTKSEYEKSEVAARQTSRLRLAVDQVTPFASFSGPVKRQMTKGPEDGIPALDSVLSQRVAFMLFGFEGPSKETIADWMTDDSAIRKVCCLGSGFVVRREKYPERPGWSHIWDASGALTAFAQQIYACVVNHRLSRERTIAHYERYNRALGLSYWDETGGYGFPDWYEPYDYEVEAVRALGKLPPDWVPPSKRRKE